MKFRVYVGNQTDRENLCIILIKNGYTVKIGKEKINNKLTYFVEYWEEK